MVSFCFLVDFMAIWLKDVYRMGDSHTYMCACICVCVCKGKYRLLMSISSTVCCCGFNLLMAGQG